MDETKHVVHEKEYVFAHLIAEVFSNSETGKSDTGARARNFVHLSEYQRGFPDDAGLGHFMVEVVSFTHALAHAGKHGEAAVLGGDVADQFLHHHGLAHSRATEKPHFAAFDERRHEIDRFDARLEHLCFCALLCKRRRLAVNGGTLHVFREIPLAVDRIAHHVDQATESDFSHRHRDRRTGINYL